MNWSTFLASVDWPTFSEADIDILMEYLLRLSYRNRLKFFEQFKSVDKHNQPKGFDEIVYDFGLFVEREKIDFRWEIP